MNSTNWLKNLLSLPGTEGLDLDDPSLTARRRQIIRDKGFLRRLYSEWYSLLAASVPDGPEQIIELGSGGGFMKEFIPQLLTTEVFPCPGIDKVMDACKAWPFPEKEIKAVLMVDVLHHLPDVHNVFNQAGISVKTGGIMAMIEPWLTPWSKFVYQKLHHEPFDPSAQQWTFPSSGPLSGANSALPWIIFHRDKEHFKRKFPQWKIVTVQPVLPFSYLLSGGVSMRSLCPGVLYRLIRQMEKLSGLEQRFAMFAYIVLQRC